MRQFANIIPIRTHGRGLVDVTGAVSAWVARHGLRTGLLTLYCRHTSASLVIQENAAPEVRADLEAFFDRIAPEDPAR
jgi:secondary thiamine-phosphate synthase enzyme